MLCQTAVGRALQDAVRLRLEIVLDSEAAAVAGQAVNRHSWSLPSATASLSYAQSRKFIEISRCS